MAQQEQQEISKIVVPIDGSKNSMEAAYYALKIAEKYDSAVAVVHVVNIDPNLQLLGIYRLSYPDTIKKTVEEARTEAEKWFTEIIRNVEQKSIRIKSDIIDSPISVVAALVNYADQERADLIVIGTKGRSGISKMLLGSVASGVVTYAPCPVLVVRWDWHGDWLWDNTKAFFTTFTIKSQTETGLGLFVSKNIIEAYSGKIWVKKNADQIGSTFTFTLPLTAWLTFADSSEFSAAYHRTRKFYYFSYSNIKGSKIATDIEKW